MKTILILPVLYFWSPVILPALVWWRLAVQAGAALP